MPALLLLGLLASDPTLILAHSMPWYEAPPHSAGYGYHWTMQAFDPLADPPRWASHYRPEIGLYDSADPAVIEYQLLSMKLAGFDGVIVDWYGTSDLWDYPTLHRNTIALFEGCERFGLRFSLCYEDKTLRNLVAQDRLEDGQIVDQAVRDLAWAAENWFPSEAYVRLDGRPVLLSFGNAGLTDEQWTDTLRRLRGDDVDIAYFSEHTKRSAALGAYDWPLPSEGLAAVERFHERTAGELAIPVAFPRFVDIYKEAGVGDGYPEIPDNDGRTLRKTLYHALKRSPPFVQVATWNDWGEGTQVEPSDEFGTRDLETLQSMRRQYVDEAFRFDAADLALPKELLALRRDGGDAAALDRVAEAIAAGQVGNARRLLRTARTAGRAK